MKLYRCLYLFLLVATLVATSIGCSVGTPASSVSLSQTKQKLGTIYPSGGEVCSQGGVCLKFPAGAVSKPVTVSGLIASTGDSSVVGKIYEFTANNESFQKEISLFLPVPAGQESASLKVAYWTKGAWLIVSTTSSADGKIRIGTTNHLSRWALVLRCASHADCKQNQVCMSGKCAPAPHTGCNPGKTRSCYDGSKGTKGIGACVTGKQICTKRAVWGACQGQVIPSKEICNGLDDDCDGTIDEGCSSQQCSSDADCKQNQVCMSGKCKEKSNPKGCQPKTEICNGLDDDCDGTIDEGCSSQRCSSDADCKQNQVCSAGFCK